MSSAFLALSMAAALSGVDSDALDAKALVQIIDRAIAEPAAVPTLTGRRVSVVLPVGTNKAETLRNFQSPARWRYTRSDQTLEILIGLGEISAANYDQYRQQGLASLPPLQTAYFMTIEHKRSLVFRTDTLNATTYDAGNQRTAVSYGLAASFAADGKSSDLPKGFLPAMAYKTKLDPRRVNNVTDGMTLELAGEVVALAGKPNILCGDFVGNVKSTRVTGDTPIQIRDKQCFVTTRITHAVLRNGTGIVLAEWGAPTSP